MLDDMLALANSVCLRSRTLTGVVRASLLYACLIELCCADARRQHASSRSGKELGVFFS